MMVMVVTEYEKELLKRFREKDIAFQCCVADMYNMPYTDKMLNFRLDFIQDTLSKNHSEMYVSREVNRHLKEQKERMERYRADGHMGNLELFESWKG